MATPRKKWSTTMGPLSEHGNQFEGGRSIVGCAMAEQVRHEISNALEVAG